MKGNVIHFPPFRFEQQELMLWRGDVRVHLTHKASVALRCLLENAGTYVSRERIRRTVWQDTQVHHDNVKVLIRELRRALSDSARAPTFIRTLPARGYMFIAEMLRPTEASPDTSPVPVFISRTAELVTLTEAFERASTGRPEVVLVHGERGAGKSTLCDTFLRLTRAAGRPWILTGFCLDRRTALEPFGPFVDALGRLAHRYPASVREALVQHAPAWIDLFPEWQQRTLLASATPDETGMIDQLAAVLQHLGADRGLIMLLEDVHWADAASWNAIMTLAPRCRRARLLIVATHSSPPTTAVGINASIRGAMAVRQLFIHPFTLAQVTRYLSARRVAPAVLRFAPAIHWLTAGNAALLATCIDTLIARQLLTSVGGRFALSLPPEEFQTALPGTITDALERLLDLTSDEHRRLLELAAVVGDVFTPTALIEAGGYHPRTVTWRLMDLVRDGYIIGVSRRSAHGVRYQFRFPTLPDILRSKASPLLRDRVARRRSLGVDKRPA